MPFAVADAEAVRDSLVQRMQVPITGDVYEPFHNTGKAAWILVCPETAF